MTFAASPAAVELIGAVGRLTTFAHHDFLADDMLRQLCDAAAVALDVDSVGVMAVDGRRTRFVRASQAHTEPWERLQEALQAGPCRDAVDTGKIAVANSLDEIAVSWPDFADNDVRRGIEAVMALPLNSRGRCWGSLDLYWQRTHVVDAHELAVAKLLADLAVSYLVMAADRAEARAAQQQLATLAMHDQLTGLPNRGLIHELIYHALAAAERHERSVAVLFVDIDNFKSVNDTYGHLAGDLVLQEVARRLRDAVRTSDSVGRLSGDEFLVLCEDLPGSAALGGQAVGVLAQRISASVARPMYVAGITVNVTASIGVAVTDDRPAAADLIHEADHAMYEAKAIGPGARVVHDALTKADPDSRRGVERRLFEALHRGEFVLHYQPILDRARSIVAVEALLRWCHPSRGIVPAAEFIQAAESTGALVPIGHWVIDEALRQLTVWRDLLADRAPRLVFCNLSPRELIAIDLPDVISTALVRHGRSPEQLGLEILENHLADPRLSAAARALQDAGHPLAIDDFGTGYSSLSRLVDIPFRYLKIDRTLVAGLPTDTRSQTLVRAVITIANDLDVDVISEGIETEDQSNYLQAAGSDLFQGYHLGRPMDPDSLTKLLREDQESPPGSPDRNE